ncbi:WXG100 family type VII secretion target [Streptomyces sp. NPDC090106]|uniref:WXG100 family type VII secretion target n=1 Tax=Streptomyces sp. NPDC090106 TaxID=3365946 RepID=UPI0037F34A98
MSENLSDGFIHVDYSHVENAADDMVEQTRAIANTLGSMEEELAELKQTWYGDDSDAYLQKQNEWDGAVGAMENLLTSHAKLLNEIHGSYRYSEQSLSELWSQVSAGH